MIYTVSTWVLSGIILLLDLRLLLVILLLKDDKMLFGLLQFLVINDCLGTSVTFWHDIPSYFAGHSIINGVYPLFVLAVIFQALQFFYGLLMLPIFALSNCAAIQFPFWYNQSRKKITYSIVAILYLIAAAMIAPLFTSCCGYSYNEITRSWYYDDKPYTLTYQAGFLWMQVACAAVMIICMFFILFKLYQLHKKSVPPSTQTVAIRPTAIPSHTTTSTNSGQFLGFSLSPRERLAISFVLLATCFLIGTATFNFIGWSDEVGSWFTMLGNQLNKAKWIIYSLFLPDVRASFFSFRRK